MDTTAFEDIQSDRGANDTYSLLHESRFEVLGDLIAEAEDAATFEIYFDEIGDLASCYAETMACLVQIDNLVEAMKNEITTKYRMRSNA